MQDLYSKTVKHCWEGLKITYINAEKYYFHRFEVAIFKFIHKFHLISIKIPVGFFPGNLQADSKMYTEIQRTANSLKNNLEELHCFDFKTYYTTTIIKRVWNWHKDRHIEQNSLQSRSRPTIQTMVNGFFPLFLSFFAVTLVYNILQASCVPLYVSTSVCAIAKSPAKLRFPPISAQSITLTGSPPPRPLFSGNHYSVLYLCTDSHLVSSFCLFVLYTPPYEWNHDIYVSLTYFT